MTWRDVDLGSCAEILTGPAFRSASFTDNADDIPLIKGDNIGQGVIEWSKSKHWPSNDADRYQRFLLSPGDVILAMDRPWVTAGLKHACIRSNDPKALLVQRVARLRGGNGLSTRFLRSVIASRSFSEYIKNIMGGTNVPHISAKQIGSYRFKLPSLDEQLRISDFLSDYDDLIENNRRRIELLEQSARLLYKEWFVHLRFPGHEHVKVRDGVPVGWETKTAFDVMEVLSGGTPKTDISEYWDGEIPFFTPKDTKGYAYAKETEKRLTEIGLRNCNSRLYRKDTLFITARGTVGKINLAQVPMAMNQSCYALVGKPPLTQFFLYLALDATIAEFKSRAVGAVFDAIIIDTFRAIPFVVPKPSLVEQFTEGIEPVFRQIENLANQVEKLREARDLLLPRLMSGEIEV